VREVRVENVIHGSGLTIGPNTRWTFGAASEDKPLLTLVRLELCEQLHKDTIIIRNVTVGRWSMFDQPALVSVEFAEAYRTRIPIGPWTQLLIELSNVSDETIELPTGTIVVSFVCEAPDEVPE
jgi:hypothetical protein